MRDLLAYLHAGGAFEALFVGKFALSQLELLDQLLDDDWMVPPALLPRYSIADDFSERLAACRKTPVQALHHSHCPPDQRPCPP